MGLTSRRIDESQKRVTSDMNLNYLHVCFNKRISTPQQLRSVRSDRQQHRDEAEAAGNPGALSSSLLHRLDR